tara:strand:- start:895 stop:1224 length:330 start_codon:yes stop_codon:yes gene_type:complete
VRIKMADHIIKTLFKTLNERKNFDKEKSYTAQLLNNPNLLAKKIGEESTELIIDLVNNNKTGIINESADLLYHLLVSWVSLGIDPEEIWDELSKRTLKSGVEEKQSRKK